MRPLTHRIHLLGQALGAAAETLLREEFGIGFSDYLALHQTGARDRPSQSEIAALIGVTDAGMSRIVSRLTAENLVRAEVNPMNRRRAALAVTAKGAELTTAAGVELEARFGAKAKTVAKRADMAAFERVLDALLAELERNR